MACVARRQITGWPVGRRFSAGIPGGGVAAGSQTGQSSVAAFGPGVGQGDQSPGIGTVIPGGDYPARSIAAQDGPALRPVAEGLGGSKLLARDFQRGVAGGAHALAVLTERRMSFLAELWAYLRYRKKLWMIPILAVLLLFGALLLLAQNSVVAPFIYTLF